MKYDRIEDIEQFTSRVEVMIHDAKVDLRSKYGNVPFSAIASEAGVSQATLCRLPDTLERAIEMVRYWTNREGVVARFVDKASDEPRLLKIKTEQYVRPHSMKYNLVAKVLFLLDAQDEKDARNKLSLLGVDYEVQVYVASDIAGYCELLRKVEHEMEFLTKLVDHLVPNEQNARIKRLQFVEALQDVLSRIGDNEGWRFTAAMLLYAGQITTAWAELKSRIILSLPRYTTQQWLSSPDTSISGLTASLDSSPRHPSNLRPPA